MPDLTLAELIAARKGDRSFHDLQVASGHVIGAKRWEMLTRVRIRDDRELTPEQMSALAAGLGATEDEVLAAFRNSQRMLVDDLGAYFRARLDEEERDALEAGARPWQAGLRGEVIHVTPSHEAGPRVSVIAEVAGTVNPLYANQDRGQQGRVDHVARWNPARVLADIAAKRAILDLYAQWSGPTDEMREIGYQEGLEDTVHALAQVYADRPDFRDEWRTEVPRG